MSAPSSSPAEARALALLSLDALPWARDWAAWRVRFAYDNEQRGTSHAEIAAFLREAVAPLCRRRTECVGAVLYLLDGEDVKPVFRGFAGVAQGRGAITTIQAQDSYRDAARIAAVLASAPAEAATTAEAEAVALPDLHWEVEGIGQGRIATARVRGHVVAVRLGAVHGQEMWVLDVDGQSGCARFRLRPDAMSKMGVAAALRACERRQER
jgi:hypothetical protein